MRQANAPIIAPHGAGILVAACTIPAGVSPAEYALRWSADHAGCGYVTAGRLEHPWYLPHARLVREVEVCRW